MRADPDVELRRVVPDGWPAVEALRLEALQDSPTAFCERYADALRETDEGWRARTARGAEGGDCVQVLAVLRDLPVATSAGHLEGGDAVLAAVSVTPACRGRGLLDAMIEQIVVWAQERSCPRLRLPVHGTTRRRSGRTRGSVSCRPGTASPTRSTRRPTKRSWRDRCERAPRPLGRSGSVAGCCAARRVDARPARPRTPKIGAS